MTDISITNRNVVANVTVQGGPNITVTVQAAPVMSVSTVGLQGAVGPAGQNGANGVNGQNGTFEWPELPSPDLIFDNLIT